MAGKGWGRTVLGWFVVDENVEGRAEGEGPSPDAPQATTDELIAKYANAEAAPPVVPLAGPLPPVVDGTVDFVAVFDAAGVDAEERDRVNKAVDLLRALPTDTPVAARKQIVEASLRAFGVPTERIIEAAVEEIEALESFIRAGQAETQNVLGQGSARIVELEAEIASVRQTMDMALREQEARTQAANVEKLRVQQVLEFFGEDAVAKVVRDSPRLHEPPTG
jgi:hypothetical protein